MIRINLLPPEYRRSERTSPKLFAATLLGVILVCSSFGWFGFVYLGRLGNLEVEESAVAEDLASKKKQATYHDALLKEKQEFQKRSDTIQTIGRSRIVWTQILDQLIETVNNDGDTERHLAWFKSIQVKAGDGKKGPEVTMPGFVQGDSIKKLADFHEDLEHSPFFVDVQSKSAPSGVVQLDQKRIPPEALYFSLKWNFFPATEWAKNKAAKKGDKTDGATTGKTDQTDKSPPATGGGK
jgi:Tfp pilus assembly protein PilN